MVATTFFTTHDPVDAILLFSWDPSVIVGIVLDQRLIALVGWMGHLFSGGCQIEDRIAWGEGILHLLQHAVLVPSRVTVTNKTENEDGGAGGCSCLEHFEGGALVLLPLGILLLLLVRLLDRIVHWIRCIVARCRWACRAHVSEGTGCMVAAISTDLTGRSKLGRRRAAGGAIVRGQPAVTAGKGQGEGAGVETGHMGGQWQQLVT